MKDDSIHYGFTDHFEDNHEKYMIRVKHFLALGVHDRQLYNVCDGEFLIHMFSAKEVKTFKVFINDNLEWSSDSESNFIGPEYVEIIGSIIDERYFWGK